MSVSCLKYFDYWGKTQKLEEGMHLGCKCKETRCYVGSKREGKINRVEKMDENTSEI